MTISEVTDAELGARAFEGANSFKIQSPTKSFIVLAENPQLKADWVYDISNAVTKAKEKKARRGAAEPTTIAALAPVMQQETEATKCNGCGKSFSIMLRKKHCKQCGSVVCNDCLTTRPNDADKLRVCHRCISIYGK